MLRASGSEPLEGARDAGAFLLGQQPVGMLALLREVQFPSSQAARSLQSSTKGGFSAAEGRERSGTAQQDGRSRARID